jgi:hypothetical protein
MQKVFVGAAIVAGALLTVACDGALSSMNPTAPSAVTSGATSNQTSSARSGPDCSAGQPSGSGGTPIRTPENAGPGQGCGTGTPNGPRP